MSDRFNEIAGYLILEEGGYSDHKHDKGGKTKHGITERTYGEDLGRTPTPKDWNDLTPEKAKEIYRKQYWNVIHGDRLPRGVDQTVMLRATQTGPQDAIKYFQGILGLKQDGRMGPDTLNALQSEKSLYVINKHHDDFNEFAKKNKHFRNGWLNRSDRDRARAISAIEQTGQGWSHSSSAKDVLFNFTPMGKLQKLKQWNQPLDYPSTDKFEPAPVQGFDPLATQSEEQSVPLPPQRPQFLGNSSEQRGIPVELFNEDVLLGNSQEPEGGQTLSHGPIYNGMRSDSFSKNWGPSDRGTEPSARQGEGTQRPRSFDIIDGNVVFMDEFSNPVRSVPLRRPPGY